MEPGIEATACACKLLYVYVYWQVGTILGTTLVGLCICWFIPQNGPIYFK